MTSPRGNWVFSATQEPLWINNKERVSAFGNKLDPLGAETAEESPGGGARTKRSCLSGWRCEGYNVTSEPCSGLFNKLFRTQLIHYKGTKPGV